MAYSPADFDFNKSFDATFGSGGSGMVLDEMANAQGINPNALTRQIDQPSYGWDGGIPRIGQPGVPGSGSVFGPNSGLGWNLGTANLALSGIGTIGSLYAAFKAQSLAKKQFEFTKKVAGANLENQIKSYNTTLADRSRSRAKVEGQSADEANRYVSDNSLKMVNL